MSNSFADVFIVRAPQGGLSTVELEEIPSGIQNEHNIYLI